MQIELITYILNSREITRANRAKQMSAFINQLFYTFSKDKMNISLMPNAKLTCEKCTHTIILTDWWIKSIQKKYFSNRKTNFELTSEELSRFVCKHCGNRTPTYTPFSSWYGVGNIDINSFINNKEEPDGFYSPWDTIDYANAFEHDE